MRKDIIEDSLFILFVAFLLSAALPFIYQVLTHMGEPQRAFQLWLENSVYAESAPRVWINTFLIFLIPILSSLLALVVFTKIWGAMREAWRASKQKRDLRGSATSQSSFKESLVILFAALLVSLLHPFARIALKHLDDPYAAYREWLTIYVYSKEALANWIGPFMFWLVILFSFLLGLIVFTKIWRGVHRTRRLVDTTHAQIDRSI
jgi:hypothetical protein